MATALDHLPPVYRLLLESRNIAADAALVEALVDLQGKTRDSALQILLDRSNESALVTLVSRFGLFSDETQALITERVGDLGAALRYCIDATDVEPRLAAIDLITSGRDYRSAYLLAKAAGNRCARTGRSAAESLLILSTQLRHDINSNIANETAADHLTEGLRQALHVWPVHFRSEILKASMIMSEWFEEDFLEMVGNPRGKLLRGFENHMIAARDDFPPRFFYVAMRSARLAPSAASLLLRAKEKLAANVIDCSWLLGDPMIARGCGKVRVIRSISDAWIDVARAPAKSPEQRDQSARNVIRLVSTCGAQSEQKATLLSKLALGSEKQTSREAFWALCTVMGPESDLALQTLAGRTNDPLSRFARLELQRRVPLSRSGPPTAVAKAIDNRTSSSFEAFHDFWNQFENLPQQERAQIGSAMFKSSPEYVHLLRSKLGSGDSAEICRALSVIDECADATTFSDSLYGHARHVDAAVRANSVELLGRVSTATTRRILVQTLEDMDERVQANAVNAISQLRLPDRAQLLASKLDSQNRRVRGNAIKALLPLRVRRAAIALINLLHSNDSQDRLTGIWVASELGLGSVMYTLEDLAGSDPDPTVRRRARSAMQGATSHGAQATSAGEATR